MDRRRNRKHSNNWNNQKRSGQSRENKQKSFQFNKALYEDQDAERQRLAAIQDVKSREIICPKCLEIINIKIDNYKLSLYDCKNGHKINDINFKDFPITQKID